MGTFLVPGSTIRLLCCAVLPAAWKGECDCAAVEAPWCTVEAPPNTPNVVASFTALPSVLSACPKSLTLDGMASQGGGALSYTWSLTEAIEAAVCNALCQFLKTQVLELLFFGSLSPVDSKV